MRCSQVCPVHSRQLHWPAEQGILFWSFWTTHAHHWNVETTSYQSHQWTLQMADEFLPLRTRPSPSSPLLLPVHQIHTQNLTCCKLETKIKERFHIHPELFTHFDVKEDALMLKKVDLDWQAMHLPINVFPVPGGPNKRSPFGGPRNPVKISLHERFCCECTVSIALQS